MNDDLNQKDNAALEALFASARAERAVPGPDLMARILADAAQATAERQAATVPAALPRAGFLTGLWSVLGGWGGAGGLAAATAAGVWLGIAPPQGLDSLTTAVFGTSDTVSLFASDDLLGTEG